MSGDGGSSQLSKLEEVLRKYEEGIGLPPAPENDEAEFFLSLKKDQLRKLSAEECGEGAYLLKQRAYHIQRSLNIETSHLNWSESKIREAIAGAVGKCPGYSYEERRAVAVTPANNHYAHKLECIKVQIQLRLDRLNYLANRLSEMARALEELQQTKRRQHG